MFDFEMSRKAVQNPSFLSTGLTKSVLVYESTQKLISDSSGASVSAIFTTANIFDKSILLLDEIDVFAFHRNTNYSSRILSSSLMAHLDTDESRGILTIGTTNSPWSIDSAFLRTGRFSDLIYVGPPKYDERIQLINFFYKELVTDIDIEQCAKFTKGYAISDIKHMVKLSISHSFYKKKKKITIDDFRYGFRNTHNSCDEWFYQYNFLPTRIKKIFKINEVI